ncbi:MAG: amidohydrolase family protein [Lautropia sp.]|nr:amidohydrolase family protein [Lautropia sp.]
MAQPIIDQPVVDSHHHIWRLKETPWLQGPSVPRIFGDYEPLRRDYSITDYMAEAVPCGVAKSVYVQVNVGPGKEVEEVQWVQSAADQHGFPHAITAFADLSAPGVGEVIDREMACGNVRAIRQQMHWHEKVQNRFAAAPDIIAGANWRRGLKEVGSRGLMFELQVFPSQMVHAIQLVRDFPDITFILIHAGMLEDRSESGWAFWAEGVREMADCPNVIVKLTGFGTFERRCSEALWAPVVRQTVDLFGPSRCLFGSNFPVEKLWTTYPQLLAVMRGCLSVYSQAEQREIFHDVAVRSYKLEAG